MANCDTSYGAPECLVQKNAARTGWLADWLKLGDLHVDMSTFTFSIDPSNVTDMLQLHQYVSCGFIHQIPEPTLLKATGVKCVGYVIVGLHNA